MSIIRFSKASSAVIKNKRSFFDDNDKLLAYVQSVNALYLSQPRRERCKTCGMSLTQEHSVRVHAVPYVFCGRCGHFNGLHEDTQEFAQRVYAEDAGQSYSVNYKKNYDERVKEIYEPKALFLRDVLRNEQVEKFDVTDIGCGGGHFVAACENLGIRCTGYDTNRALIELAKRSLARNSVELSELNNISDLIRSVQSPVTSLIGVLEHLIDPRGALEAFCLSRAEYLYLQVPLFSLSVILESSHPTVFPRQLNAGHTHLYTEASLNYLKREFNLLAAGEWWFGTDIVDLFRHLHVLADIGATARGNVLAGVIGDHIDELQGVLDRRKVCSGVNLVLKKA